MELQFTITITGRENYTWQGRLRGGGEEVPFRSDVELLLELNRLMGTPWSRSFITPGGQAAGQPPPSAAAGRE